MEAVADHAGSWPIYDDILLDGAPGSDQSLSADYTLSTSILNMTSQGVQDQPFDFDSECYMKIKLEKFVKARANLIIINGSSDSGGYGLDKISTNNYRYSADQEVYMINLNVLSGSGRWVTGLNTILVPRAIALECKLNYSLEHLNTIQTSDPLWNASFVSTNTSQPISSAHVIVVISKNVSAAQAETLLYDLTHNSTNGRIGNNVSISTTNIYLLHLPSDVLAGIPMNMENAGFGPGPRYIDLWGGIVSILNFILKAAFFVLTFGIVLTFYLIDLGMKVIGPMLQQFWNEVKQAVDILVNALQAFLTWAISFVGALIHAMLDPIANAIYKVWSSYKAGMAIALDATRTEYVAKGSVSAQTIGGISKAMEGDLYFVILGVAVIISVILIALIPVTSVFSFLLGFAMSAIVLVLISQGFGATGISSNELVNPSNFKNYNMITSSVMLNVVRGTEQDHPPAGSEAERTRNIGFATISMAIGIFGAHLGIAALPSSALKIGFAAGIIGIVSALLAAALAIPGEMDGLLLSVASVFFSLTSLGAGVVSLVAGGTGFEMGAGLASLGVGAISLFIGLGPIWYHG